MDADPAAEAEAPEAPGWSWDAVGKCWYSWDGTLNPLKKGLAAPF